jgi:hypothetical protein
MKNELLKAISDKLTILIRLQRAQESSPKMTANDILDLVEGMGLTDIEVGAMFGVTAQTLRNARSERKNKGKKVNT